MTQRSGNLVEVMALLI